MSSLRPCPSCARHVRVVAFACPFCEVALTPTEATPVVTTDAPPNRSALVFGVAVGAVAVSVSLFGAGCLAYGAPSGRDAGDDAAASDSGGSDTGSSDTGTGDAR